jgi:hypothetical protein
MCPFSSLPANVINQMSSSLWRKEYLVIDCMYPGSLFSKYFKCLKYLKVGNFNPSKSWLIALKI